MKAGRAIHQLSKKVGIIGEILHRAGKIDSADLKCLSKFLGINYDTLKTLSSEGRIVPEKEMLIARLSNFDSDHPSWFDRDVATSAKHNYDLENYKGRDCAENFREYLSRQWTVCAPLYHSTREIPNVANKFLAKHSISDCGQTTLGDMPMSIFLEADFGILYDESGIKYGFRRARFDVEIRCDKGARAENRLGKAAIVTIGNARILGRGTSVQPTWTIEVDQGSTMLLEGEYATRDEPLFHLVSFANGTIVESTLSANLHDGSIISANDDFPLTPNQRELIKQLCARDIVQDIQPDGWLTLCQQRVVIAGHPE